MSDEFSPEMLLCYATAIMVHSNRKCKPLLLLFICLLASITHVFFPGKDDGALWCFSEIKPDLYSYLRLLDFKLFFFGLRPLSEGCSGSHSELLLNSMH